VKTSRDPLTDVGEDLSYGELRCRRGVPNDR